MPRRYYKEPDVTYGRPKKKVAKSPPDFFRTYDEEMKGWNARRFMRELVMRQGEYYYELRRQEWEGQAPHMQGVPITDPDEINKFLCRPSAVSEISSKEDADQVLRLGMILIAIDPNTPNLVERLSAVVKAIRKRHPLKKQRGRPSKAPDVPGIGLDTVGRWRDHRIVALHDLRLRGYDPRKDRKQLAAWMFPEQKDQRKRGQMLDRSRRLLDEALAGVRSLDAQTR